MRRFDGAVAVVTGASSGIGRRVALDLVERGATVVGLARRAGLLEELAATMRQMSPVSGTEVCDVSDAEGFAARLAEIEAQRGRIDVLVNDAGIEEPTPVTVSGADLGPYRRIFATNFFGLVAGTLAVLPGMLARGSGIVVNVSSDSARARWRVEARTRRARPRSPRSARASLTRSRHVVSMCMCSTRRGYRPRWVAEPSTREPRCRPKLCDEPRSRSRRSCSIG